MITQSSGHKRPNLVVKLRELDVGAAYEFDEEYHHDIIYAGLFLEHLGRMRGLGRIFSMTQNNSEVCGAPVTLEATPLVTSLNKPAPFVCIILLNTAFLRSGLRPYCATCTWQRTNVGRS
jgi:hypothetical protein